MIIGLDFDNVIAETGEDWEGLTIKTQPVSDGVVDLLNNNFVSLILTGREDLHPVFEWVSVWAPKWEGEIHSAQSWEGRKGPYLAFRQVNIFVDDMLQYVEDIRESGVSVLHFVKEVHCCPKKLLAQEGYLVSELSTPPYQ